MTYYLPDGTLTSLDCWMAEFDAFAERRVGSTTLRSDAYQQTCWVSTVFIGIDMSFGEGPPLIYETMIFGDQLNEEQWRWSTEEDARAGHEHIVQICSAALPGLVTITDGRG